MDKGYLIAARNHYCYIQAADTGWFPDIAIKQANRKEIPLTAEPAAIAPNFAPRRRPWCSALEN